MPTYWEPWPGKTKATVRVEGRRRRAVCVVCAVRIDCTWDVESAREYSRACTIGRIEACRPRSVASPRRDASRHELGEDRQPEREARHRDPLVVAVEELGRNGTSGSRRSGAKP